MCNKPELHLCNTCRLKQGYKRNKMQCITPQLSHCKGCGEVAGILPNKHWKQISAPLKDELRDELNTWKHKCEQLEYENTSTLKDLEMLARHAKAMHEALCEDNADLECVSSFVSFMEHGFTTTN